MALEQFSSENDYLIYFQQFPQIFFESKSGGEEGNEVTQVHPGGGGPPVNVEGPTEIGQLTVMKSWDSVKDVPLEAWSTAWSNGLKQELVLVVQPVNSAGIPIGKPDTFKGCSRVSFTKPDVNKGSAEAAKLEIVLQPRRKL